MGLEQAHAHSQAQCPFWCRPLGHRLTALWWSSRQGTVGRQSRGDPVACKGAQVGPPARGERFRAFPGPTSGNGRSRVGPEGKASRLGPTRLRTGLGPASGNVDQIHNAVAKACANVVVLECLRESEPLWDVCEPDHTWERKSRASSSGKCVRLAQAAPSQENRYGTSAQKASCHCRSWRRCGVARFRPVGVERPPAKGRPVGAERLPAKVAPQRKHSHYE
jgi:hypothetical protein